MYRLALVGVFASALAACDGGGSGDRQARPDEMRVRIIAGREIVHQVRTSGGADVALQAGLISTPVIVQLSVVASASAGDFGTTGPSSAVTVPPGVLVNFRVTGQTGCTDNLLWITSGLTEQADTAVNFWREHTQAITCAMHATAVKDGQAIGSDSAVITYTPGPVATWSVQPFAAMDEGGSVDLRSLVSQAKDVNGNAIANPTITAATSSAGFTLSGLTVSAAGQGTGVVQLTSGTAAANVTVWALEDLRASDWRLSWGCDQGLSQSGTVIDSVRASLAVDSVTIGSVEGAAGRRITFYGLSHTRVWMAGQPFSESQTPNVSETAHQRPAVLRWSSATEAVATAGGYEGGSLCTFSTGSFAAPHSVRVERL